jgi:hypothetical protein
MYNICLIDDKSYWIPQVINSIPKGLYYQFYYYDKIDNIEDIKFDIVILDFYLDKDNKTALDIIDRFKWSIIIWFSSVDNKNDLILSNWWLYKAQKLRNSNINSVLWKIMKTIF